MFDNTKLLYNELINGEQTPDHREDYIWYFNFFSRLSGAATKDISLLNEMSGLKIKFSTNKSKPINDVLMRKACLYPTASIFLYDQDIILDAGGETACATYEEEFFNRLFELTPLLQSGLATLLPNNIIWDDWTKRINEAEIKDALMVSMTVDELKRQLMEEEIAKNAAYMRLLLPELRNIPIDVLINVRQDEGEAFEKFQMQLENLLMKSKEINSEIKLLDLMKTVDEEIHMLDQRFHSLKKVRALESYDMVIGLIALGICILVPPELAKYIMTVFGTKSIYNGLKFISGSSGPLNKMKTSDFYLPWHIHNLSNKIKKKSSKRPYGGESGSGNMGPNLHR